MLSFVTFAYQTNLLIYGTSSFVVSLTLIALFRNLFCRKSTDDIYGDKLAKLGRNNSRSFADYSRSKSNRSVYEYNNQKHKSSFDSFQSKNASTPHTACSMNTASSKNTIHPPTPITSTTPVCIQASPTPTSPITMNTSPIPQFAPFTEQHASDTVSLEEKASYDTADTDYGQTDTELERINNAKKRKSISISINIPNFKLPRMPSIGSRPTLILKKVLRRMEYGQYDSQDIHLVIRSTSIIGCMGFLFALLTMTAYYLTRDAYGFIYFIYGAIVCYGISKFIIHSLSLLRLYFALNNSCLQYSVYIYAVICALLLVDILVFCIASGLLYLQYIFLSIYCAALFFLLDIVFISTLYILFTKRMFELFENTSTFINETKSKAEPSYHDTHPRDTVKSRGSFEIVPIPSPASSACNTPRKSVTHTAATNNLSIHIASACKSRDHSTVYPMHPISSVSPVSLKATNSVRVKSYSADIAELTLQTKESTDTNDGLNTNINRSLSNIVEENINTSRNLNNRESSKTKRKREKWKHYQKQQASGIEYVTRYSVLVLLSSLSSLAMAAVLIYEEQFNFDGVLVDDAMEFHIVLCVDMIINCITIYFYFIFGRWLYQFTCCVCHAFVQRCYISLRI